MARPTSSMRASSPTVPRRLLLWLSLSLAFVAFACALCQAADAAHADVAALPPVTVDTLLAWVDCMSQPHQSAVATAECHRLAEAELASAGAGLDLVPTSSARATPVGAFSSVIQRALDLVAWSQQNATTPFLPPFSLQQLAGAYPSYIGFNLVGGPTQQLLRRLIQIYDSNGFVSDWVVQMLVEAHRYSGVRLDDATILRGVNFTLGFQEKNGQGREGTMDFWREVEVNGTWRQFPENVEVPIELLQAVSTQLQAWCAKSPDVCPAVQPIVKLAASLGDFLSAFGIPADFDDSGVNLALGGLLQSVQESLPTSWAAWTSSDQNRDPTALMETYVRYCYRPFATDPNQNRIDPRTYYYLREFLYLEQAAAAARGEEPSLMLITTWSSNTSESNREFAQQHKMPFQANNVDGSVVGNSLFGILTTILRSAPADGSGVYQEFVTPPLLQLIQDSTRLLAWIVTSEILLTRNDIVLLYYPPTYDFFLFAARSLHLLQSSNLTVFTSVYSDPATEAALTAIQSALASALANQGTATLVQKAQTSVSANTSLPLAYFDDFLGNADVDAENRTDPHYDDRLFSTAIATLALQATWTIDAAGPFAPTSSLAWLPSTSDETRGLVTAACQFLSEELVAGVYRPANSFFSGSVKGATTLPFAYPINTYEFINGTMVPWRDITWGDIQDSLGVSMSGVISEDDYQAMMAACPLGMPTPTVFRGYNLDADNMVYWSSPPLTYAAGLLALTKCQALAAVHGAADQDSPLERSAPTPKPAEWIAEM